MKEVVGSCGLRCTKEMAKWQYPRGHRKRPQGERLPKRSRNLPVSFVSALENRADYYIELPEG